MYGMGCRETDSSSQETGATDADEVRCTAHAHRSPPSKAEPAAAKTSEPAAAKTSERPRRASPSTPDICAQRPASKPTSVSNAPQKYPLTGSGIRQLTTLLMLCGKRSPKCVMKFVRVHHNCPFAIHWASGEAQNFSYLTLLLQTSAGESGAKHAGARARVARSPGVAICLFAAAAAAGAQPGLASERLRADLQRPHSAAHAKNRRVARFLRRPLRALPHRRCARLIWC